MASDHPGDVRTALLDAARHELDEHGPGGVSLRAVARRAGVSHAAPKHHFGDRAGLLTVVATDGHRRLAEALRAADEGLGPLGRAYVDFGLRNPAVFELMFSSDQVHPDDPDLVAARQGTSAPLVETVARLSADGAFGGDQPVGHLALTAWAFVHGLVVLVRDGALRDLASAGDDVDGADYGDAATLARALTDTFTRGMTT